MRVLFGDGDRINVKAFSRIRELWFFVRGAPFCLCSGEAALPRSLPTLSVPARKGIPVWHGGTPLTIFLFNLLPASLISR